MVVLLGMLVQGQARGPYLVRRLARVLALPHLLPQGARSDASNRASNFAGWEVTTNNCGYDYNHNVNQPYSLSSARKVDYGDDKRQGPAW